MKTGRIGTIILVTVIVALAVCLLPWPSRVNVTLPGAEVNSDNTVKKDITLSVEGWYLKYLLQQDQIKASVLIHDSETDTDTAINIDGPVFDTPVTEIWCTAPCYHAETNEFEVVGLAFGDAMDTFILKRSNEDSIYVAAPNVKEHLPKILERFSFFLD